MANPLTKETIWFDKVRCESAEQTYQEHLARCHSGLVIQGSNSNLVNEIARARKTIQNTLSSVGGTGLAVGVAVESTSVSELKQRLCVVEEENRDLKRVTQELQAAVVNLQSRVTSMEKGSGAAPVSSTPTVKVVEKNENGEEDDDDDDDDDDDIDLFGSDDDEEETEKLKQERIKAYSERKAKKGPGPVAKSSLVLDVKPWDDETDMAHVEKLVRSIETEGLLWGAAKLVPIGYGIKKLQISCVIEDDKVGTDFLEESITAFEDYVQSMDVAAFNKI